MSTPVTKSFNEVKSRSDPKDRSYNCGEVAAILLLLPAQPIDSRRSDFALCVFSVALSKVDSQSLVNHEW